MGRKISQFISIILLMTSSFSAWGSGTIVFDATNAPRLASLVAETKRQLQEMRGMSEKMESLNSRLGGGVINANNSERLSRLNSSAREWGVYLDSFCSPDADQLSILGLLEYRNFGSSNTNKLMEINQFLADKLYPSSQTEVSIEKLEEIKKFRNDALEKSSLNGVALAGEKKHSLGTTQRKIAELGSNAIRSPTIHDDLVVTNQLLTVIATELTQQRELLSQQLELMSAVVAHGTPLVAKRPQGPRR